MMACTLALAHGQVEAVEDLLAVDLDVQVLDFQQMHSNEFLTLIFVLRSR